MQIKIINLYPSSTECLIDHFFSEELQRRLMYDKIIMKIREFILIFQWIIKHELEINKTKYLLRIQESLSKTSCIAEKRFPE